MTLLLFSSDTAAPALTTLEEIRQYLNVSEVDSDQDDVLTSLIVQASRAIMRYTEREFSPVSDNLTRVFGYDGGRRIDLAPYDLRAVTSITLDSDLDVGQQTVVGATDYRLGPLPASDDVYQYVDLRGCGWTPVRPWWGHRGWQREVTIVGDWGWPVVPADVERACILTVKVWYERDVAGFSRTYGNDETVLARPLPLPNAATEMLAPYRNVVVA